MKSHQSTKLSGRARGRRLTQAFTLIEMVLVLAIIALLMGTAIKALTGFKAAGQKTRVLADIGAIGSALTLYESSNYSLPTTEQGVAALVVKPNPAPRAWSKLMRKDPIDPWGNHYHYRRPPVHEGNEDADYDLFSAGKDLQPGTEDDIGNWMDM